VKNVTASQILDIVIIYPVHYVLLGLCLVLFCYADCAWRFNVSFNNALIETKTGICASLKSDIYFRFVSQTLWVEPSQPTTSTFPSRMQNVLKTGNE